jgi:hypothetical protein
MNPISVKFLSEIHAVYHSDRDCHTKLRGEGALIAVSEAVFGPKCRFHLEQFQQRVWL